MASPLGGCPRSIAIIAVTVATVMPGAGIDADAGQEATAPRLREGRLSAQVPEASLGFGSGTGAFGSSPACLRSGTASRRRFSVADPWLSRWKYRRRSPPVAARWSSTAYPAKNPMSHFLLMAPRAPCTFASAASKRERRCPSGWAPSARATVSQAWSMIERVAHDIGTAQEIVWPRTNCTS